MNKFLSVYLKVETKHGCKFLISDDAFQTKNHSLFPRMIYDQLTRNLQSINLHKGFLI